MIPKLSYFSSKLSRSITKQSVVVIVAILVGTSALGISEVYYLSSKNAERALDVSILKVEKMLKGVESAAQVISSSISHDMGDSESIEVMSQSILEIDTNIVSCTIAFEKNEIGSDSKYRMEYTARDYTGQPVTESMNDSDYNYLYQDWYQIPMLTGKSYWNEPSYDIDDTSLTAAYSMPFYDDDDNFQGVIRVAVSLDWLSKVINLDNPYETAVTLVLSQSGTFIAHGKRYRDYIMNSTVFSNAFEKNSEKLIEHCKISISGNRGSISYPADGVLRYVCYAPLYNGWHVLGICSFGEFFGPVNRILLNIILIGLIGIFIQHYSMKKKIKRMTTPISILTYSTMNMSRGKFNTDIPVFGTKDEIQKLASSIRLMQKNIETYIHELKTSTQTQERIQSELNVAKAIQASFLPRSFPSTENYDCYGSMTPAKSVGGDLFDFRQYGRTFSFAIGDVSGKGVPAAIYMAITKAALNFKTNTVMSAEKIIGNINNAFCMNNDEGMFLTMFLAKVDLDSMEMIFCNAGHNHIILIEPDGSARYVECKPNIAVGVFPDFKFEAETVQLKKGCRIIAYTDGITEAENVNKELFGEERLLDFASGLDKNMNSKAVTEKLLAVVNKFTAGNEQNDDITVFTVRF